MATDLSAHEEARYARNITIREIGREGQQRLQNAAALVVGVGGLGSPAALYLAAAGVGRIGLVDQDVVEISNLQRQVIHSTKGIGQPKVAVARQRLLALNPHIQVDTYHVGFDSHNARRLIEEYDVVVDGTDNLEARYAINEACVKMAKPYVYGAVARFEGQVSVFDAQCGPCYRCLFPALPPVGSMPTAAELGVLGAVTGIIGALEATEAIKLMLGIGESLIGRLLLFDGLDMNLQVVNLRKNPTCKTCGRVDS